MPVAEKESAREHFGIVITAKMRHGDLWALARGMGGQSALARHLGVAPTRIGSWINLKSAPSRRWMEESPVGSAMLDKLFVLCGKTADDLWPTKLRAAIKGGEIGRRIERWEEVPLLMLAESMRAQLELPSPADETERSDTLRVLNELLAKLGRRGQAGTRLGRVLELRFGLNGEKPHTFAEIGEAIGVSPQRAMQLENTALIRLRKLIGRLKPEVSKELAEFVGGFAPKQELH